MVVLVSRFIQGNLRIARCQSQTRASRTWTAEAIEENFHGVSWIILTFTKTKANAHFKKTNYCLDTQVMRKNILLLKFMQSPFLNDLPHTPKKELYFQIPYINTNTNTINLIQ